LMISPPSCATVNFFAQILPLRRSISTLAAIATTVRKRWGVGDAWSRTGRPTAFDCAAH
jgi:hypothetical protein